jgi:hypothetical protein
MSSFKYCSAAVALTVGTTNLESLDTGKVRTDSGEHQPLTLPTVTL